MRRGAGLVLIGLGTLLIVFAVLMPTWVSSRVIKFPLNEYISVSLTDPNASYFSAARLTEMTGVNVEATETLKGNAAAGSSSTAVWNQFVWVQDVTNNLPIQSTTRTMAFDRRTARLVNCCGANVNGDSSIRQSGYVGYVLPIGTQKRTYDVFDTNLNRPVPFAYAGKAAVGGTEAYRFVANVPPTRNGTRTVPGSLVGMSQASVTLPQYYEAHVTYWIDPVTGALLNVTQSEKLTLRNSAGGQGLLLFQANLAATPDSVDRLVAQDNSQLSKMSFVGTLLPLVAGMVGLIVLVVGILLARRPREEVVSGTSAAASAPPAEPAGAAPPAESAETPAGKRSAETPAEERSAESAAGARPAEPSIVPGLDEPREAAPADGEAAPPEAAATDHQAAAKTPEAEPAAAATDHQAAAETPAAETPAAAEDAPAEAPTAEMTATTPESPEADAAAEPDADADADAATTSRRGRRGAHRR